MEGWIAQADRQRQYYYLLEVACSMRCAAESVSAWARLRAEALVRCGAREVHEIHGSQELGTLGAA